MTDSRHDPLELQDLSDRTTSQQNRLDALENNQSQHQRNSDSLPPVDRGWAAWRLLLAAFVFESLLWGFPLSFGVFQNYYAELSQFKNQPYVSVIGTVASGIAYMGAPVVIPLLKRFARYRQWMIYVGWVLCILAIISGSFAKTLGGLIFTQGIMYGVGFIIFYYPIIGMVNEYWIARRGMAYGVLCSASGISGIVMPITLEALLKKYGYETTLRAVGVGLAVCTGPLIPVLKGRNDTSLPSPPPPPSSDTDTPPHPRTEWHFLRVPLFWIYTVSNLLQGLGFFFPSLYLPSYATFLGLSSTKGALLLSLMSISQVAGQLSFGFLSDHSATWTFFSLNVLTLSSTLFSALAVFTLWGLARSFSVLVGFVVVYGFFGAGYSAMWARMGTSVTRDGAGAFTAFGMFNLGKGVGNVLAGPISAVLLQAMRNGAGDGGVGGGGGGKGGYGAGKYRAVILFNGACMVASAVAVLGSYARPWKSRVRGQ